ncbi:MAG: formyltransferase family protein [Rhodospirillales bacterium]
MPEEIVLLTGEVEGPHFRVILESCNPALRVVHAQTLDALEAVCLAPPPKSGLRRLISFATSVIVPKRVLDALGTPAYNFHPGPPTYPGSHAASFAVYDGAERFGATAHEMTEKVDSGPIVAVEWFEVPAGAKFMDLELLTYETLLKMFADLAPHLAGIDEPLPVLDVQWSGKRHTKAEFEAMKELEPDMDEAEIKRRYRAFG